MENQAQIKDKGSLAPSHLRRTELRTLLLHPKLFKASLFTPSEEVSISLKSFLTAFFHSIQERPAFRLALDGWLKRMTSGNLSSFIHRTWPLNLSFIIALESGIQVRSCIKR